MASKPPLTPSMTSTSRNTVLSASRSASNNNNVDENTFLECFEKVPSVQIYSARDVEENFKKYNDMLMNKNEDWVNRVDCLKKIRSYVIAGATKYEEFHENLLRLQHAILAAIDELRSQVVREACITVAFLSKSLENKLERFCETVLPNLINLVVKTKVHSVCGIVCIRFIIQHTRGARLIPIITSNLNSKSAVVRKTCCELVYIILKTWNTHTIERQLVNIKEALRKGIADGDSDARSFSRQAFVEFSHHFPEQAERLKNSLDSIYRKQLENGSVCSSSSSLNKYTGVNSSTKSNRMVVNPSSLMRSRSAIDPKAAEAAKGARIAQIRTQYAVESRAKLKSGDSMSKAIKPLTSMLSTTTPSSTGTRSGRPPSRVSISQPSSRSGSPSSRFSSYSHYLASANTGSPIHRSRKRSIGNGFSSRETSPGRPIASPLGIRSVQPIRRPLASQRLLQASRDAENDLADALDNITVSGHYFRPATAGSGGKATFRGNAADDHSDESETSSLSSEHSFNLYTSRPSDCMSWNGSQHRIYRDLGESCLRSVAEMITCCENSQWNIRRKGMESLLDYMRNGNQLEFTDLKRLMDIFMRIFNDPHMKMFGLFLDTLNELIHNYSSDLHYCLRLLLTRLFNKLGSGTHLLDTIHSKIIATLENVYESFPHNLQLQSVFHFLTDPTQTPSARVKTAALHYLVKLALKGNSRSALTHKGDKDYPSEALTNIISWTKSDNLKSSPELRRACKDAIVALFSLDPNQLTRIFSAMPSEYQETAQAICRNSCGPQKISSTSPSKVHPYHLDGLISTTSSNPNGAVTAASTAHTDFSARLSNCSPASSSCSPVGGEPNASDMTDSQMKNASTVLSSLLEKLTNENLEQWRKQEILSELFKFIHECPSDTMIGSFKLLLSRIVLLMAPAETASVKEQVLNILQAIVKRRTVNFLVKESSVLIITRVISLYADRNTTGGGASGGSGDYPKEVAKAAESCAMLLCTHLPSEDVVKTVVPLISTSELSTVKLISIKMLTRLVESTDNDMFLQNINQIMSVLIVAYDDNESAVRKAAVFCMVALYKHSDELKAALMPYFDRLPSAKKKLLMLYITRAEHSSQSSSVATSPRNV